MIKKYISYALAFVVVLSSLAVGLLSYGLDDVPITKEYFPDDVWRNVVLTYLDYDGNGILSYEETDATTLIDVSGFLDAIYGEDNEVEIADLTGIEYFTALQTLRCGGIGIEALDVSSLARLTELTCQGNYLEELNLSKNKNLNWLNCSANFFESLDVSGLTNLTRLDCHTNMLTSLDVSGLSKLTFLSVYQNELTQLNLSGNPSLSSLNCSANHLKTLDLSHNPLLSDIIGASIGNQTVWASAKAGADSVYVDIEIENHSRIVSTSLDRVENVEGTSVYVSGYDGSSFVAFDMAEMLNGIDYNYGVNLPGAENMSVHINVERNFYLVRYYDSESLENQIGEEIVNGGEAAAFELTELPQCKKFVAWSEDLSAINADIQVYAIWSDDHDIAITSFDIENGIVHTLCKKECGLKEDYVFSDLINVRKGDDKYVSIVDINSDGIINAKDYAYLLKGVY